MGGNLTSKFLLIGLLFLFLANHSSSESAIRPCEKGCDVIKCLAGILRTERVMWLQREWMNLQIGKCSTSPQCKKTTQLQNKWNAFLKYFQRKNKLKNSVVQQKNKWRILCCEESAGGLLCIFTALILLTQPAFPFQNVFIAVKVEASLTQTHYAGDKQQLDVIVVLQVLVSRGKARL